MNNPELGGNAPPEYAFDTLDDMYESFRCSVADELCTSLAQDADVLGNAYIVSKLAGLEPERTTELLARARLSIAAEGVTESNRRNVCCIADAYAEAGEFGEALAVADAVDTFMPPEPGRTDRKMVLFRWKKKQIPEEYFEQAVLTLGSVEHHESALEELLVLGEYHPAVRSLVIGVAGQIITDRVLPEAETPEAADQITASLIYYTAKWGDMAAAKTYHDKIQTPAQRLRTELEVAQLTNVLLKHEDSQQLYQEIAGGDSVLTGESKAYLLLELQKLGHSVDGEEIRDILEGLDEGFEKVQLMSTFAAAYNDPEGRHQLVKSITEQFVEAEPLGLWRIAKEHPGLLIDCEAAILSRLVKGGGATFDQAMLAEALLKDYVAADQLNEAITLAESFEGREFFDDMQALDFHELVVASVAGKGPEHFEQALSLVATFSKGEDSFHYGTLLATLVASAHDYLTPDQRESYLQACDGSSMTYHGWLKLAKSTKHVEYLIQAKQYVIPPETFLGHATYQRRVLEILEAYHQTTGGEASDT